MNFFLRDGDNINYLKSIKGELTVVISDTSLIKEQTDKYNYQQSKKISKKI